MNANTFPSLTDLRRAVQLKEQIETLQNELSGILGELPNGNGHTAPFERVKRKYTRPIPETRGEAVKRGMTPEGRAALAESAKARWRRAKAAGKKGL